MPKPEDKSFAIPKQLVWEAWRQVKANKGAPGVDGQDLDEFEADLEGQPLQDLESDEFRDLASRRRSGRSRSPSRTATGSECSACRRSSHTAVSSNELLGSLVVTHPFHPLFGQRLEVLYVRREAAGRMYVCDGGDGRNVKLDEAATDRGPVPAERPLTFEVLVEVAVVIAALGGEREDW